MFFMQEEKNQSKKMRKKNYGYFELCKGLILAAWFDAKESLSKAKDPEGQTGVGHLRVIYSIKDICN